MADHSVVHEVFYDGDWHDVSDQVHEPSNTTIRRGVTQFGDLQPSEIEWTFEDPAERWVPGNPASDLYGKVNRAAPCRVTIDGSVRAHGEAAVFAPDRTEEFEAGPPQKGRAWVEFRADGLLARIGSWSEPLRSPMYRMISRRSTLVGHWPMEEGRQAEIISNTVPGGAPAVPRLMDFGDDDSPAGATSAARFTEADNTSRIDFQFLPASSTAGWQVCWALKLPALPSITTLQIISWRTSNGYRWIMNMLSGLYQFKAIDPDGVTLLELNGAYTGAEPDQWVMFRVKATVSAGTVTMEPAWYVQGQTTPYGVSGTFSGSVGYLVNGTLNGNAHMNDALLSHVFGVTTGADDLLGYAARRAFDGYVGELAGDRFSRLLDEEGIAWSIVGAAADTLPMGRQVAATLSDQLREISATDRCLVYDARTANEVELRTREDLYRQTAVEFTWPGDIAPPFRERYDYVGVANRVTATQRDGGEATAALESGAMSVQPAPDGIGERKGSIDVNVADEAAYLGDLASWELAHGTVPGARFPSVTFDLDGRPDLAAKVAGVEIGDRITIDGFRFDLLDLIVLTIAEFSQQTRRKVTFTCAPGAVFSGVTVYDDAVARYDSASTTLKGAQEGAWFENFAGGADGWSASDGTVAASTAQAHSGTQSGLLTVVGSPSQTYARDYSRPVPVTPGDTVRVAMWVRSTQALSVIAAADFVDGSFGYINGAYGSTVVLVPNTWTRIFAGDVVGAGATQAIVGPTILSGTNGQALWVDDIILGVGGATVPDLLVFRTADENDLWSTTEEPFEVVIEGERMRAESVGAAALVSGAWDQSVVVTRGLNLFKDLPAGAPIHVATPGRYAL